MPAGGKKPYPPEKKKSEILFVRVTLAQYAAFRKLGDRFWLRKLLDSEIERGILADGKVEND